MTALSRQECGLGPQVRRESQVERCRAPVLSGMAMEDKTERVPRLDCLRHGAEEYKEAWPGQSRCPAGEALFLSNLQALVARGLRAHV